MKTKNSSPEKLDEETILTRFIMSLIRTHYEPDLETKFIDVCRDVSRHFDEKGKSQLASYVNVLTGDDKNVWVPM